ncbi:K potassium transporter [Thermocrinis albus DSM 14484]|uniref:K potassium transporter n=1 Tax=Thermocrinis albus (strain DSM 14484 / JCM 11386 / HI 11/12) TaxID=638303 RepID=D3SP21_THEAH|nr:KUP/HAK/KT family potassium transporter [Thermocrinis albus]ADC88908.1 K potassium transporter [Thermocrinis albus DSM 14484]
MGHAVLKDVRDAVRAMGAVFGDIGTSPLYTLTVVVLLTKPSPHEILGVVSLIFWTLVILVTVQYSWFAMNLSIKGEGGTVVLGEIAKSLTKSNRLKAFYTFLVFVGLSFLMGDGVITPAITILSSSEGLRLVPGLEHLSQGEVVLIAIAITVFLFALQPRGTGKIGDMFGPIMLLWFSSIGLIGLYYVMQEPSVLRALSPHYALEFLLRDPFKAFVALSEVFLAATGGEAMYADMGHLGRVAIRRAWMFVFPMLVLNYLGQAVYVMKNPNAAERGVFYESAHSLLGDVLYVPFILLVIMAGVIASQALISGVFSIVFQAINIRIFPLLHVKHTSTELSTQIYIPTVNWMLMLGVIFMYFTFWTSDSMAAAYGFAVSTVMVITGFFLLFIHIMQRHIFYAVGSLFLLLVDLAFFLSNSYKIPHGAYWSLAFASLPLSVMLLYTAGQRKLYRKMSFMPFKDFLLTFEKFYQQNPKIKGSAIFLVRDLRFVPPYVVQTIFQQGILYEDNVFLSLVKKDEPFGVETLLKGSIATGLRLVEIKYGYMEILDIEKELRKAGIEERVIFYGVEQVYTEKILWKIFGWIKRSTPSFVEFYQFPPHKLHGVTVRVEF